MRLLRRKGEGIFELTRDMMNEELPRYAILSHTWQPDNDSEVSFEDMTQGNTNTKPDGYAKIRFCSEQANKDGLEYFWVDTCCINKKSSSEVQEAITTMFSWYRNATRCYAYLTDVSVGQEGSDGMGKHPSANLWESAFRNSRWFTRGWTLQELLAPESVEFFSREGTCLGDKTSLRLVIQEITGIPDEALKGDALSKFSVKERLSWAANRQTKRKEDKAYCLLGIFNVFMPLLYGEEDYALQRLQQEIDKKYADHAALDHFLSMLPVATEASFNSLHNQHEPTCHQNTRTELLQHIAAWVEDTDERCIFWLNGIAGTGKSTVARTVARTYYNRGELGGSFFFVKGGGDLSKGNKLATTLARQLATRLPEARRYICEAIMKQEDIMEHSLQDQWEQLIINPLSKLASHSPPSVVLLIVDALDECDNENDIRVILRALTTSRPLTNIRLRIFITSRPDTPIRHGFNKMPDAERKVFVLHEMSHSLVNRDLTIFFENNFTMIREERGYDDDWPGSRIITRLVEISCGLFIWASTACRYIFQGRWLSMAQKRIDNLVHGFSSGVGPEKQLDQIYTAVLQDFIQQDFNDEDEKEESYIVLREVLGTIVILCSPLSMESLARLLNRPLSDVKDTLADLHTIFNIPSQGSRPVRLHHPTFRDFLLNKKRCTDLNFWVDEKQVHRDLGDRCLVLMSKALKRNICGLESPGTLVNDLDPDWIKQRISPDLQYACLYWVEHYRQSGIRLSDGDPINDFFMKYFLCWLEAINLMGKSAEMGAIIRLYHSLLMPDHNLRQIPFAKDARRLIFNFQNIIKHAPLQTYCAALAFIPPTNELKVHFWKQKHPWIEDIRIAEANVPKAKDEFNYVSDLAFTLDSKQIASGSNFEAVRFWDVATKTALRKYEAGSTDKMSSVAISPDGRTLAGGSDDFTVMAWDIRTGALHYSIKAHTGWVNSVVFSPDGKLLASGSMDQTVALWDAVTGKEVKRIDNQSSCVNSATFSPNGLLIATGSVDAAVRLWDFSKELGVIRMMFDGHLGPINSVRFSPSGKQIVSGSDDMTIKIWDTATGAVCMTLNGHTKKVMAVSFSLDARLIASGSEDKTVKIWDATTGAEVNTLRDHTSGINSIIFSPNGTLLASSSFDDEVRLWDTKFWTLTGKLDDFEEDVNSGTLATQRPYITALGEAIESTQVSKGHSNVVTRVVFSPDGQWLASGSQDATIKLWLEDQERWELEGHSGIINDLVFSPGSQLVASASTDMTVRLWSPITGLASHTLEGHSGNVVLVLFSSDGQLLGSCSSDNTVRLWDPVTGEALGTLEGHSGAVNGIAFSPDNRFIVSWSVDTTALIWDLSTNTPSAVLRGHSGPINSVAYSSDGELVVSCSEDATIRLWSKDGTPYGEVEGDSLPVSCAAFSPDNQLLASCSNKIVKLWDPKTKSIRGSLDAGVVIRKMSFSSCGRYIETDRGVLDIGPFLPSSPTSSTFLTRSHALFVTQTWLRKDMKNAIWLPDEYQATDVAIFGNVVVMGHLTGSISFIHLV